MAEPTLRLATITDRPAFLRLWKGYMTDHYEGGGQWPPTEDNLREYLKVFESYMIGTMFGFCLLAEVEGEPAGCLLVGEDLPGGLALKGRHGRLAVLWGVYVEPAWRRRGLASRLDAQGVVEAQKLGFEGAISSVLLTSKEAEANAFGAIAKQTGVQAYASQIIIPFGDS